MWLKIWLHYVVKSNYLFQPINMKDKINKSTIHIILICENDNYCESKNFIQINNYYKSEVILYSCIKFLFFFWWIAFIPFNATRNYHFFFFSSKEGDADLVAAAPLQWIHSLALLLQRTWSQSLWVCLGLVWYYYDFWELLSSLDSLKAALEKL